MQKLINRKAVILIGLSLILAAGGLSIASNMGFKFVKSYLALPSRNTLALPYFQSQFVTAADLFTDLGVKASAVCKYDTAPAANLSVRAPALTVCWTPGSFNNFTITDKTALEILVTPAGTQVIVGAHNPSLSFSLQALPKTNVIPLPYHTTYLTAADIFNDIPGCNSVSKVLATAGTSTWTPGSFNNFSIVIGDVYEIQMSSATSWVPDHY